MLTQFITGCSREQRDVLSASFLSQTVYATDIFFSHLCCSFSSLFLPLHISSRSYTICATSPSLYAHCCILFLLSLWSIFSCFPVYTPLQRGVLLNVTSQEGKQCGQSANPSRGVSGMGSCAGLGRTDNFLRLIRYRALNINPEILLENPDQSPTISEQGKKQRQGNTRKLYSDTALFFHH